MLSEYEYKKLCDEILYHIQSKEIEPLSTEHIGYLKSETEQDGKIWGYKKKLNEKERNYKL